jgi:hypothetical protein
MSLWLCLLPRLVLAQERAAQVPTEPPVDPTAHRHVGFYFHVDVGPGYFITQAPSGELAASADGISALISVALGGAVAEDWILAGEIWGAALPSPRSGSGSVVLSGFGLNVTHYFMPANVFLTLTPSATVLSVDNGIGTTGRTEVGFGTRLALGKEWWVGNHWGLGMALQGYLGINRDQGAAAPTWWTLGGGILFSATYN